MNPTLADLLNHHLQRSLYSQGQLALLSGVPKNTLTNWLAGRVTKPHQWHGLVRVASALRLTAPEADALLFAAGHPSLTELRRTNPADRPLFALWATASPVPFQALPDIPYFVGREAELEQVQQILQTGGHFCCLRGMGGVGKTALAARLAYAMRPAFPDGVLWARLDTSDSMTILYTLAGAYGLDVSAYTSLDSRAALVRGLLAHKRALLILDNAESSAQLAPLLPPTTGTCAVLVTTRFELAITDGWPRLELHPFAPESSHALTLFARFFGPTRAQKNRLTLQEIAAYVGHLPLALAILAAQLGQPTQAEIQAMRHRLQASYDRLSELEREQRSVRATFEITYTALPPDVQWFFAQLGAFGGEDFTDHAVSAVTEISLDEAQNRLRQLRQLSLVQDSRADRFRLHPLLRDFAREKLLAHTTAPYARMIRYYLQQVASLPAPYTSPPTSLLPDISNLIACLDLAYEHHLLPDLLQAIRTFFEILYQQGLASVLEKPLNQAIAWTKTTDEKPQQAEMFTL
ncbi:MAG TPA: NB-ARC domain-containing protein, partial [Anaerolineales bacterium]|nr:NB-ARC domain-containing protein [Anaerolineales bacterium]